MGDNIQISDLETAKTIEIKGSEYKSVSSELDPEVSQASTQLAYDEAIAEQKDMESLTNKFLQLDPDYSEMNHEPEDRNAGEDNSDKTSEVEPERFHKREKQLNSNWMELSRSIAAKKDLIDWLAENQ